jgi:membrane protein
VASAYGAAGSVVLLLVWVYYSAQILFFGAELTQVYARRHGSRLGLTVDATTVPASAPADTPPSPRDVGRTVRPKAPAPLRSPSPPPPAAVGRGLALSAVLLLLGQLAKKKGRL